MNIKLSDHFLPKGILPEIGSNLSVRDVFAKIFESRNDGFILTDLGEPRMYVVGSTVADALLAQATRPNAEDTGKALNELAGTSIGRWISQPQVRAYALQVTGADHPDESQLRSQVDAVFRVTDGELDLGWYLNHESILNTATGRIVWICSKNHENPDPDHGTCNFCPFPIVKCERRQ